MGGGGRYLGTHPQPTFLFHLVLGVWFLQVALGISFVLIYESLSDLLVLSFVPVGPLRVCHGPWIMQKLSQKHLQDIHATLLFLCLLGAWNCSAAPLPAGAQGDL